MFRKQKGSPLISCVLTVPPQNEVTGSLNIWTSFKGLGDLCQSHSLCVRPWTGLLGVKFLGTHCVQSDVADNRIKQEGVTVWLRLLLSLTPLRKV